MSDSEKPKSWRKRKQSIKYKWAVPFVYFEWKCEQLSALLNQWAFLDILGYAGRFTVLVAVVFYIVGCPERQKQAENQRKTKHYQAWQVINDAHGKTGSGGRIEALQDLNRDRVSLALIDVSGANLTGINIKNAILRGANLSKADLPISNLSGADLLSADLSEADLAGANLSGAYLSGANLTKANLEGANLTGANLFLTDLSGANLGPLMEDNQRFPQVDARIDISVYNDPPIITGGEILEMEVPFYKQDSTPEFNGANLIGANLEGANLTGAELQSANLQGANLRNTLFNNATLHAANLSGADLSGANLSGAYLQEAYLQGACLSGTNLKDVKNWQTIQSIELANIYGVKNPPNGFEEWAKEQGAFNIEDDEEWKKLIRDKMQKQTKEDN